MSDTNIPEMPKVKDRTAVAMALSLQLVLDRLVKEGKVDISETIALADIFQKGLETLLSGESIYLGDVKPDCPVCGVDLQHPIASYMQFSIDNAVRKGEELSAVKAQLPVPNAPTSQGVN